MALEKELATYEKLLPTLTESQGKFALISGEELAGVFGTYEDALTEGYKRYVMTPFLVKQIQMVEQVHYITRQVVTACRM